MLTPDEETRLLVVADKETMGIADAYKKGTFAFERPIERRWAVVASVVCYSSTNVVAYIFFLHPKYIG
jgi:hypothetical protein